MKFKPHKWTLIRQHQQFLKYLRQTGRKQIIERLEIIKKNEELPNDILTTILKSHGKNFFLFSFFFVYNLFIRGARV